MKTFTYPRSVRSTLAIFSILGLFGVLLFPLLRDQQLSLDTLLGFFLILTACLLAYRVLNTKVTLDEERITYHGVIGEVTLNWSEVDEGYFSSHLISIASTTRRKRITFGRTEYVFSLEPYEMLYKEVVDRVVPQVVQRWKQLRLPIEYVYPGLSRSSIVTYGCAFGLVLFFFVLFVLREGLLVEKLLFLISGTLLLFPFLIRDYLRNRRTLILEDNGLRERNGREKSIAWQEVSRIVVSEEPLTNSLISVESHTGESIKIPRSLLDYSGQILYLIRARTNVREEYT